jgi:hypothetical protein
VGRWSAISVKIGENQLIIPAKSNTGGLIAIFFIRFVIPFFRIKSLISGRINSVDVSCSTICQNIRQV